ncbi:glycosyltransferase [Rothia nasimurium]|uniref:glycosyltransferase n=1 Tax=Rothia nasimurium TaxID=85336 RepID=UPI001F19C9D8|nr:glycosyltransferase [Rothia nasimurium]
MAFIGITRFSLYQPDSGAWKSSRNGTSFDRSKYLSTLYAKERIEPRLKIFLEYSLPLISQATIKHNIKHIVRYSTEMPETYQQKIQEAAEIYPFLILDRHTNGQGSVNPYKVGYDAAKDSSTFAFYRLDDDDLLSTDFFDQTAKYVSPHFAGMRVSLAQGITALFDGQHFSEFRSSYHPMIAIGLLDIYGLSPDGSMIRPPDAPHNKSDRYGSVIVNAEKPSYFWTRHVGQDTSYQSENAMDDVLKALDKFPSLAPNINVGDLFPTIRNNIKPRKLLKVASEENIPLSGRKFELSTPVEGSFELHISSTFATNTGALSALVYFDIEDQTGVVKKDNLEALPGFSISSYQDIGYFSYLSTAPGNHSQALSFRLPHGYKLKQLGIVPFGPNGFAFKMNQLNILQ